MFPFYLTMITKYMIIEIVSKHYRKLIELYDDDELKNFQSDLVVYHDDAGDYSTNEPTMDGTASLIYYLSSLESSEQDKK